jgi:RNA polymerase sigma-70 factor, ECF subfamily
VTRDTDITRLLVQLRDGDSSALGQLLPLVYDELSAVARRALARERSGHTLSTHALVHEAYMRLADQTRAQWQNRGQFFAIAAMVMRRVLVNHAQARARLKRGAGLTMVTLDEASGLFTAERAQELVELDEALQRLSVASARAARVVECRYFAGLSIEETAAALQISPVTVKRDWQLARAWLRRALGDAATP